MNDVKTVGVPLVGTQNDTHKKGNHKGLPLRKYNRRSLRLKHYDYSKAGFYFITICTQGREHLFGEIVDDEMVLGLAGEMVYSLWYEMIDDFPNIALHEFVIMPNHIHGIIEIVNNDKNLNTVGVPFMGTQELVGNHNSKGNHKGFPLRAMRVGDVVGAFKSLTTNTYIRMVKNKTLPPFNKRIWQRNYYEHVIRDAVDYGRIAMYIVNNPLTWEDDVLSEP